MAGTFLAGDIVGVISNETIHIRDLEPGVDCLRDK